MLRKMISPRGHTHTFS